MIVKRVGSPEDPGKSPPIGVTAAQKKQMVNSKERVLKSPALAVIQAPAQGVHFRATAKPPEKNRDGLELRARAEGALGTNKMLKESDHVSDTTPAYLPQARPKPPRMKHCEPGAPKTERALLGRLLGLVHEKIQS